MAVFTAGRFLAGGGAVFAIVELAVGDDFIPQHVPQMPHPALGLADNGHRAFRLELRPQLHGSPRQYEQRGEEGHYEDGVNGVLVEAENYVMLGEKLSELVINKKDRELFGINAELTKIKLENLKISEMYLNFIV